MRCQRCGHPIAYMGPQTEGQLCECPPTPRCIGCGRNAPKRNEDGACVLCMRTLARVEKLIAGGQR